MSRDLLNDFPVDIVYLWCDSSDSVWREKKNAELKKYGKSLNNESTADCRYINNDELKYALRSLEKFAPWIRNVFIVTDNQVPDWLDVSNPKIKIIDHKDILPKEVLPTFNSCAIETVLHKIPDLAEHFLFANDDMFFGKPVEKSFFFTSDGEPIFRFSKRRIINKKYRHIYGYTISRAYKLVKSKFKKSFAHFPHHNIDAYRKSDLVKCYDDFREEFEKTTAQKFREWNCVQRSIYGYYSLANSIGKAYVVDNLEAKLSLFFAKRMRDSLMVELHKSTPELVNKLNPYLFCFNDNVGTTKDDRLNMKDFLSEKFPEPSSFEKKETKTAQILICYHKDFNYLKNDICEPIQVGVAISDVDLGILKDNTLENISAKNKNYCELTALYWLWKNSDADFVGLMHYRRLFDFGYGDNRWYNEFDDNIGDKLQLNQNRLNALMSDCEILLPMKRVVQQSKTIYLYYQKRHYLSDLDRTLEIIQTKYPQMYETAIEVLKKSNQMYLYNMFVSSKEFLNEYASWLFDILGTLEAEIQPDVETRDIFQQRVYGFLSERLFTIYVEYKKKQGLRYREIPVAYCETNRKRYDVFQTRRNIYKILTKLGIRRPHWKEQYGV